MTEDSRLERRTYYIYNNSSCILKDEWPEVASIGMVVRERIIIHRDDDGEIMDDP